MALFTDFFPTAGDNASTVAQVVGAGIAVTISNGGAAVTTVTATRPGGEDFPTGMDEGFLVGDHIEIDGADGLKTSGVILTVSSSVITVALDHTSNVPNGTSTVYPITTEGITAFTGTVYAGGDVEIATGDESTVSIGNTTAGVTNITGADLNIGTGAATTDVTGATTNITGTTALNLGTVGQTTQVLGSLDVDQNITIDGTGTVTGALNVTGDLDLEGTALTLVDVEVDHALGIDVNGVVRRTNKTDFAGTGVQGTQTAAEFLLHAGHVSTWAEGNNTDVIPSEKLPQFVFGQVFNITLTDDTAVTIASLVSYLNDTYAGPPNLEFNAGDIAIVLGAGTSAGDEITVIYTSATAKTTPGADMFEAGDFHAITGASTGVTSVAGSTNIHINGAETAETGAVVVSLNLDGVDNGDVPFNNNGDLHASGIAITYDGGNMETTAMSLTATETVTVGARLIAHSRAELGSPDLDGTADADQARVIIRGSAEIGNSLFVDANATIDEDLQVDGDSVLGLAASNPSTTINGTGASGAAEDARFGLIMPENGVTGANNRILGIDANGVVYNTSRTEGVTDNTMVYKPAGSDLWVDTSVTYDGTDVTVGSALTVTGASNLQAALNLPNIGGVATSATTFLHFGAGGSITSVDVAPLINSGITGTAGTLPVFGATGLEDSSISEASGVNINIVVDGMTNVWSDHRSEAGSTILGIRILLDAINAPDRLEPDDSYIGATISFAGMEPALAFLNGNSYTIVSHAEDYLEFDAGMDASAISSQMETQQGTGSVIRSTSNSVTVDGSLTVDGLAHTGNENANVVVTPTGELAIGAGSGGAGFDLLVTTDAADAAANTAGGSDLVVLVPISQDSIVRIPQTATAGTFIEVSNVSLTNPSTGSNRWEIRGYTGTQAAPVASTLRVMGSDMAATEGFRLDDATASFKMVYTNATYGWVIIGAN